MIKCTQPPVGWECSRAAGHNGPCADYPKVYPPNTYAITLKCSNCRMMTNYDIHRGREVRMFVKDNPCLFCECNTLEAL